MIKIDNVTITENIINGVHRGYNIKPNDGYVLHDKNYDEEVFDRRGKPTGEIKLGYCSQSCGCGINYDFSITKEIEGHTAFGEREFFARPEEEVDISIIF